MVTEICTNPSRSCCQCGDGGSQRIDLSLQHLQSSAVHPSTTTAHATYATAATTAATSGRPQSLQLQLLLLLLLLHLLGHLQRTPQHVSAYSLTDENSMTTDTITSTSHTHTLHYTHYLYSSKVDSPLFVASRHDSSPLPPLPPSPLPPPLLPTYTLHRMGVYFIYIRGRT